MHRDINHNRLLINKISRFVNHRSRKAMLGIFRFKLGKFISSSNCTWIWMSRKSLLIRQRSLATENNRLLQLLISNARLSRMKIKSGNPFRVFWKMKKNASRRLYPNLNFCSCPMIKTSKGLRDPRKSITNSFCFIWLKNLKSHNKFWMSKQFRWS